jgi:hypothetical protein
MNQREERALVKRIKARDKQIQAGHIETAAWMAQQDDVKLLCENHTQAEVGKMLGKKVQGHPKAGERCGWVSTVVNWKVSPSSMTPFARDAKPGRRESVEQAEAKKVFRDPEGRKKVLPALSPTDLIEIGLEADEALEDKIEQGSIDAEEAAKQRQEAAAKRPRHRPKKGIAKPDPRIEEQLTKVAMKASDSNFLMWKIMEEIEDVAPARGEQQVWRLARVDHTRDAHDLGMRMAEALRKRIETDELDEALRAELEAELNRLGRPVTEEETA